MDHDVILKGYKGKGDGTCVIQKREKEVRADESRCNIQRGIRRRGRYHNVI